MEKREEMRVLIDTNILISAVLNPKGAPQKAIIEASTPPNICIVSFQSIEEAYNTFQKKFPSKLFSLIKFITSILPFITLVMVPPQELSNEELIRDTDDRTIYRAAVKANADIILTGDKDLLESGIVSPQTMTAREFLNLYSL